MGSTVESWSVKNNYATIVNYNVKWIIEAIAELLHKNQDLRTDVFRPCSDLGFRLIVKRYEGEHEFWTDVFLQLVDPTPVNSAWTLSSAMSIDGGREPEYLLEDKTHASVSGTTWHYLGGFQSDQSTPTTTVHFLLKSITRHNDSTPPSQAESTPQRSTESTLEHMNLLVSNLQQTLIDYSFLDCTFDVPKQQANIKALRCLLALRSPVFKSMLQSDMREIKENRIIIEDFDAETVKNMVNYIHTSNVDGELDVESNLSLLMIADKYDIAGLRKFVSESLVPQIDASSIYSILDHAVMIQGVDELRDACVAYVSSNFHSFKSHDSFKALRDATKIYLLEECASYGSKH